MTHVKIAEKWKVHKNTVANWKFRTKQTLRLSRNNARETMAATMMKDIEELHGDGKALIGIAKAEKDVKGGAAAMMAVLGTIKMKGEITGVFKQEGAAPPGSINIQMLIGMPHTGPLREGEDEGPGPDMQIEMEKSAEDFYGAES